MPRIVAKGVLCSKIINRIFMRTISILLLSSEAGWRGGEVHIFLLAKYLTELGVDVTIGCKPNSKSMDKANELGLKVLTVGLHNAIDVKSAFRIARYSQDKRIQIIHAHSSKSHAVAIMAAAILGCESKIVITKHTLFPISRSFTTKMRYSSRHLSAAVGVSEQVCQQLLAVIPDSDKVVRVFNAVEVDEHKLIERQEVIHDEDAFVVGTCCALTSEKNLHLFVDVIAILKSRNYNVKGIIVGDGVEIGMLKYYVHMHGLDDTIQFLGFKPNAYRYTNVFDLYLQTSLSEGFGLSLLEACLLGKICITSNVGAATEIVASGAGVVVDGYEPTSYADAVESYIVNGELPTSVGLQSRAKSSIFSPVSMAKDTLSLYERILK
jgi:Glycosyltransferase